MTNVWFSLKSNFVMPVQHLSVQSVDETDSLFLVPLWFLSMARFSPFGLSCSAPVTLISGQRNKTSLDTTYRKQFNTVLLPSGSTHGCSIPTGINGKTLKSGFSFPGREFFLSLEIRVFALH